MLSDLLIELSVAMKEEGVETTPEQLCDASRYILSGDSLFLDPNIYQTLQPILVKKIEDLEAYYRAWNRLKQKWYSHDPVQFYRIFRDEATLHMEETLPVQYPKNSGRDQLTWKAWQEYLSSMENEKQDKKKFKSAVISALAKAEDVKEWEDAWEREMNQRFIEQKETSQLEDLMEKALSFRREFAKIQKEWKEFSAITIPKTFGKDKIGEKKKLRPVFIEGYRANVKRWGNSELFHCPMENLKEDDLIPLQQPIREMAQRLRVRLEGMKEVNRGKIDMKKTMKSTLKTLGEPMRLVYFQPKRRPARWVVLSDVSGSVKHATRLFMSFLFELRQVMDEDMRAFVFVSKVEEITEILKVRKYEEMLQRVYQEGEIDFRGYSDYGVAFRSFDSLAADCLDRETIFLIIGDARNNNRDPCLDILKKWVGKARKIIWFNPDLPEKWDQGDSIISLYRNIINQVYDVSTPDKCLHACYHAFLKEH